MGLVGSVIGLATTLGEEEPLSPVLVWNLLVCSRYFLFWALLWAALARHTTPAPTIRASPRRHVVDYQKFQEGDRPMESPVLVIFAIGILIVAAIAWRVFKD